MMSARGGGVAGMMAWRGGAGAVVARLSQGGTTTRMAAAENW